jgi:DNA mismatch endonuclease, patch repair protein
MDNLSKEKRSKVMAAIRSKNTKPELALQAALTKKGLTYQTSYGPQKIDIALTTKKVAIFVDGCFWHGCSIHAHPITTNEKYWQSKIIRNKERDCQKTEQLRLQGWVVLRVWEHELLDIDAVVARILRILN